MDGLNLYQTNLPSNTDIESIADCIRPEDETSSLYSTVTEQLMPVIDVGHGLTIGDLCCGIGGFSSAGARLGMKTAFAADIKLLARSWYEKNHRHHNQELFDEDRFFTDLTKIDLKRLPRVDVITAGFPCQPFSKIGRHLGRKDPRGTLIYSIADIVKAIQPSAIVLENSDSIVSDENGQTLEDITKMFAKIGYRLRTFTLDATDYGAVAQRSRLYLVGFRGQGSLKGFKVPRPIKRRLTMSDIVNGSCHAEVGLTVRASGLSGRVGESHNHDSYIINGVERHLSGAEARRLMGFPDSFLIPERRIDAYELLGNSVSLPLVYALLREVVAHIHRLDAQRAAAAAAQTTAEARLKRHIVRIKGLLRQRTSTAIDIGHELIDIKDALPHGRFGPWLRENFALTPATARNWMAVARVFGHNQADIEAAGIADTVLIELLRVPDDKVRVALLARGLGGELVTVTTVREEIRQTKASESVDTDDQQRSATKAQFSVDQLADGLEHSITQSRVSADAAGLARDIAKVCHTIVDLAGKLDQGQKRVLAIEDRKALEATISRLNARIGHLTSIPVMHTATCRSGTERIVQDLELGVRGVVAALVRLAHGATYERILAFRDDLNSVGFSADLSEHSVAIDISLKTHENTNYLRFAEAPAPPADDTEGHSINYCSSPSTRE